MQVPFFRPSITDAEVSQVVTCLTSGWLTSGPVTRHFESAFAEAVGAQYSVALNSCTAALHLAVEALGLKAGQAVLVPTMTFAATAEIVRYQGAVPVLVDCDPTTLNMDLTDAAAKIDQVRRGRLAAAAGLELVGMLPVHVGGLMMDVDAVNALAREHGLWVVEDAAHAFPAAWRPSSGSPWQRCGENTSAVTCYSFYANKTITTGEGGMAVTADQSLADHIRMMSLHGLSHDAWGRYSGGTWDYRIVAPGYKYNLTDIASAIGMEQLKRAEALRQKREQLAAAYADLLADVEELELPPSDANRIHAWHLYPVRLRLEQLSIDRNAFVDRLKERGVGCSVHWRPLHLHPYYAESFGWKAEQLPTATRVWQRLVSLPLFPDMTDEELRYVVEVVSDLCRSNRSAAQAAHR